jgi:hypothetical protein
MLLEVLRIDGGHTASLSQTVAYCQSVSSCKNVPWMIGARTVLMNS